MIKNFSGRFSKHIAWFLLVVFYGEMAGSVYANGRAEDYTDFRMLVRRAGPSSLPLDIPTAFVNDYKQELPVIEKPSLEIATQPENTTMITGDIDKVDEADKLSIGGPGQPEMSTFKSVSSDNMVNLFTGDFSYNIPLGDVAGFPINIFYNAGASMDQEASWVGLGWNLNPGTISRNMRGLPDDYSKIDSITKIQSIKPDRTIGATGNKTIELIGAPQQPDLTFTGSFGIFYNNRRGLGIETGGALDYNIYNIIQDKTKTPKDTLSKATTTISGSLDLNSQNGMSMSLGFDHNKQDFVHKLQYGYGTSIGFNTRTGLTDIGISGEYRTYKDKKLYDNEFSFTHNSNISFARSSYTPSIQMPVTRSNYSYTLRFGKERTGFFRNGALRGYIQESRIASQDTLQRRPAYGFMYYEQANKNPNALLDFNRINDRVFTKKTPVMAIPVYTYDVFTISGEGTGGTFRGYRGNMGHMRDHANQTRNGSLSLHGELGKGNIFHAGVNIGGVYSPTFVRDWKTANTLGLYAEFNKTDSNYQSFYFKNPAEKAIIDEDYYNAMGGDRMIRPYLGSPNSPTPYLKSSFQVYNKEKKVEGILPITSENSSRGSRDKRTQVITCLTAEEASQVGLDRMIYSYEENDFRPVPCGDTTLRTAIMRYDPDNPRFYRKADHISYMEVLEGSGQRYIYGIPVYQVKQQEVSFSTSSTPTADNLVPYTPGLENSTKNDKGRDGFYQREIMDGYAHSYLLTAILSPDYVDVTGDGISDDDLGTAIKLNYSRVNKKQSPDGKNYWNSFKWRMPVDKDAANYNEGLKADDRDGKGLYTYGEKELWYMHSIESKNMVATFHTSERLDGLQVKGENGEANKTTGAGRLRKLDRIDIFTKAEYQKQNPVPIKSIKFSYSYKLCRNYSLNANKGTNYEASGKLTLDEISCSYNGNVNQNKNRYVFKYAETSGTNPDYKPTNNDRWGNYKDAAANPSSMSNQDYPYTSQVQATSNTYAGAWNLERILLPSGGVMKIEYEADDYGYVQDKRACEMTEIVGFSNKKNGTNISNKLYDGSDDYCYVYFDAGQPLTSVSQIREKYLQDFKQLLLKLWVKMPKGNFGNTAAFEPVVVYGVIDEVGINPNNTNQFYVHLEKTRKDKSPMMETVVEFLKEQLPARAYPGYEVNGDGAVLQVIRAVFGLMMSFKQGVLGFERELRGRNKCNEVDLSKSFARLNTPDRKKIGGGYRVKKITVRDNWHTMTNDAKTNRESVYGQVYNYTTTEEIGGQKVTISSGVASYEPGIGNEENPFREVLKYEEKQFLGPTSFNNIELPVAETFFPSPSVGYSKVSVRSIHTKETHDNKNLKSAVGMQQTEFFTTRDFPVISEFTSFDGDSRADHRPNIIKKIFNFDKRDYLTLTQGFRIVLNDMNGKMKSQTSFAENDLQNPISYTENFYRTIPRGDGKYRLDNVIPVVGGPNGKVSYKTIGKDIEIMNDFRENFSYTMAANIPLNADFFRIGNLPILLPGIFRLVFRDESMFRSAATLKVVNEYGILDSVVNIDKGSVVGTKNLVYDAETGNPLVTRTYNEFKKPVYSFSYPAWWSQTGMEPAYRNIDLTYSNVKFRNGRIEESPHVDTTLFESGDEIYVSFRDEKGPKESIACAAGVPQEMTPGTEYLIWAVDLTKDTSHHGRPNRNFIFLDRYGKPYTAQNATIRVIRSGKRNIINASVGSITSLANPVVNDAGQLKIVINNNTNVINASAMEFKEKWRANDLFYAKDTILRTVRITPIRDTSLGPDKSHAFGVYRARGDTWKDNISNQTDFSGMRYNFEGGRDFRIDSWLRFDLGGFSSSNTLLSASLKLYAHGVNQVPHNYEIHKNKDHAQCPDQSAFYKIEPGHTKYNPHISTTRARNDFFLSRMLSTWPGDENCSAWESIYESALPLGEPNIQLVPGTSPLYSAVDYTIPVTSLVKGMLRDKFDVNKNYATAFRLSIAAGSKDPARVCFWATAGDAKYSVPTLNLKYYSCSISDRLVYQGAAAGAPTVAPADSVYCISDEVATVCLSRFDQLQMNPYIQGVIGNYRPWRSYVYYGERRESDPTIATDIRKDGVIKDYESFWAFAADSTLQIDTTGSDKWVWNSEVTQYNRKGAELENHDPLNRYNCGIYGYQETLPIAIANNSRLRLSGFDGFEDYSYSDQPCEPYCKPYKRHFKPMPWSITDEESHTGKYSARVPIAADYSFNVPVSPNDSIPEPTLLIDMDTIPKTIVKVTPKGIGLKGVYYNNISFSGTEVIRSPEYPDLNFTPSCHSNLPPIFNQTPQKPPPASINCTNMSAKWIGTVQVITTGQYYFDFGTVDDEGYVAINGVTYTTRTWGGANIMNPVTLTAGTFYDIEVRFIQKKGNAFVTLKWIEPGSTQPALIPLKHLYPDGREDLHTGTTETTTLYCIKPDTVQVIDHKFIDTLNLIPGRRMVASVWMKKGGQDCKCSGYTNEYKVKKPDGTVIASFAAKERIIEGWQQFEAVFIVPDYNEEGPNYVKFDFPGVETVSYIDDLRIHPFNANMKSFVYDPVTLRLAAELDENNYAAFYEYDDDGGLVRVKKETREGIKTIKETRSAQQKGITNLP